MFSKVDLMVEENSSSISNKRQRLVSSGVQRERD
jgi:hypothetical protein